jgi:hypothetical protein
MVLVWLGLEERARIIGASKETKDEDSPSGGGHELVFLDGLAWMQVDKSLGHLTICFRRIWSYPPFVPPPLYIFNQ